jgi:hypothetical protein
MRSKAVRSWRHITRDMALNLPWWISVTVATSSTMLRETVRFIIGNSCNAVKGMVTIK